MTDTESSALAAPLAAFDGNRPPLQLSPADAAVLGVASPASSQPGLSAPPSAPAPTPPSSPPPPAWPPAIPRAISLVKGCVSLRPEVLRYLRAQRYMSQQELANDCWRRNIVLSIATIKRAEAGESVRLRTAREFARCFGVPIDCLLID